MEFIWQNLWLVILAVVSGVFLVVTSLRRNSDDQLSPADAVRRINRENAQIVDVRDYEAFAKGHIPGAIHLPLDKISGDQHLIRKIKGKPVIAYCETGVRADKAVAQLKALGLEDVCNLVGGSRAWCNAGFPLARELAGQ